MARNGHLPKRPSGGSRKRDREGDDAPGESAGRPTKKSRGDSENLVDGPGKASTPEVFDADDEYLRQGAVLRVKPQDQVTKESSQEPAGKTGEHKAGIDEDLPPMSDIKDIFKDLTKKSRDIGFGKVLEHLGDKKKLRVGTMCSGTDGPVFGLLKVQSDLQEQCGTTFQMEHCYSAEIDPLKQNLIAVNTDAEHIFRDVREMAFEGVCATAYGAGHLVPKDLDVVIAGFSCVDFSHLNPKPKTMDQLGESGDTFNAIRTIVKRTNPKILILENVKMAPWETIAECFQPQPKAKDKDGNNANFWDGHPGFATSYGYFDSKDYWIPQMRNRGYMVCLNRVHIPKADVLVKRWPKLMEQFQRPASSSIEAFLLAPDDLRLINAKEQMQRDGRDSSKAGTENNWLLSRVRHEKFREEYRLGKARPVTNWVEGGSCQPPDFMEYGWTKQQVERICDTFEICFLRNITRYKFDSWWKMRCWNVSQNVDRDLDVIPWGITQCLTPTGIHVVTLRGGPMVGLETLSLQGLPIDELVFNRETDKELMDLSGNAMTTTLVTAAALSAIMLVPTAIGTDIDVEDEVQKVKYPARYMDHSELEDQSAIPLTQFTPETVSILKHHAHQSVRLCLCEGHASLTSRPVLRCSECGHTACQRCSGTPAHFYQPYRTSQRITPQAFQHIIKDALPMRLYVSGLKLDTLIAFETKAVDTIECDAWIKLRNMLNQSLEEELRFHSIKRTHCWTITYIAPHSRLELVFSQDKATWFLYAEPEATEPGNSPTRAILKSPIARMEVRGNSILDGSWELGLPRERRFTLKITPAPAAQLTAAWESTLGLQDPGFVGRTVWDKIRVEGSTSLEQAGLETKITGDYYARQQCGAANGSLHVRVPSGKSKASLFLFLDPSRIGPAKADRFTFSTDNHRLNYGEDRHIIAYLDASYRPSNETLSKVECTVPTQWFPIDAQLKPFEGGKEVARYGVVQEAFDPEIDVGITNKKAAGVKNGTCRDTLTAMLCCDFPVGETDLKDHPRDNTWRTVGPTRLKSTMSELTFVLEKVRHLDGFSDDWRPLHVPQRLTTCKTCSPPQPDLKWQSKLLMRTHTILPYEDEEQALHYEKAMKELPEAFSVQIRMLSSTVCRLRIGLNIPALAHWALAHLQAFFKLQGTVSGGTITAQWRFDVNHKPSKPVLPRLTLRDNSEDPVEEFEFEAHRRTKKILTKTTHGPQLREDQKQSLSWILSREREDGETFKEKEVSEAVLAELGWRAEVMVTSQKRVLGGVLADQVGFGKTATTLALIDKTMDNANHFAEQEAPGKIPLKATLIIVPATLCTQWTGQVTKFLGSKYKVEVIREFNDFKNMTIKRLKACHIVIVAWSLFDKARYTELVAYLASLPPGPEKGGRAFSAWFDSALEGLSKTVDELKEAARDEKLSEFADILNERLRRARTNLELLRRLPTERLKGSKYESGPTSAKEMKEEEAKRLEEAAKQLKELAEKAIVENPFGLRENALDTIAGVPLHIFKWYRVVLDEWTYVDDLVRKNVSSLQCKCIWVLSGTPPLGSFHDIKTFASLLGVHLGRDDDSVASMTGRAIKRFRQQRTSGELFQAFKLSFSHHWYEHRHSHAQDFLDFFVRQNSAKAEGIACEELIVARPLAAVERTLYTEMEQNILASGMRVVKARKSKDGEKLGSNERILEQSRSGEAALLKRSSVLDISGPTDPDAVGKSILMQRVVQHKVAKNLLETAFEKATWLEFTWGENSHYTDLIVGIGNGELGDPDETGDLLWMIQKAKQAYNKYRDGTRFFTTQKKPDKAQIKQERERERERKKQEKEQEKARTKQEKEQEKARKKQAKAQGLATEEEKQSEAARAYAKFLRDLKKLKGDGKRSAIPPDVPNDNAGNDLDPEASKDEFPPNDDEGLRALRAQANAIRRLIVGWKSSRRSLRYFNNARQLQAWNSSTQIPPMCEGCHQVADAPENIAILGVCGHFACTTCLTDRDPSSLLCVKPRCGAQAQSYHLQYASVLGADETSYLCYGTKLDAIINLIKAFQPDEQALLFVQFEDLGSAVENAFDREGISYYSLLENSDTARVAAMLSFQDNPRPTDREFRQVLILNPSNESAAGANLTGANHVIFVSPLLAESQDLFNQSVTQCIGRARRNGQTRLVHVHKFCALRTIDVDCYQQRTGSRLVQDENDGEWFFVPEAALTAGQQAIQHGTGIDLHLDGENDE